MSASEAVLIVAATWAACVVAVFVMAWALGVKRADGDQSGRERGFKTWQ